MASFNNDVTASSKERGRYVSMDTRTASFVNSAKASVHYKDAAEGTTLEERSSIGHLLYRLSGLLLLQSLLSKALEENRYLKNQIAKLENLCSSLTQQQSHSSADSNSSTTTRTSIRLTDDEYESKNDSLLSSTLRSAQLQLSKLQATMTGIEGTNAPGLVKQNYELRETCQHQRSVIEDLERQLGRYHQLRPSESGGLSAGSLEESVIKSLSEYEKVVAVERTLARELGIRLEQRSSELEDLNRQLDVERYGRQRAQSLLRDLLNDFIVCCLQMSYVSQDSELKLAFEDLMKKSELLTTEFREDFRAAVEVISDDHSNDDFLRNGSVDVNQDGVDDLTMSQAREKIKQLQDQVKRLHKEAKSKIIEQMRKHKQATMKLKDTEERLKKSFADKSLVMEQLGQELRQMRAQLDEFIQSLGYRSSYATQAAESVRPLVELLEDQKKELQAERDALESEVFSLRASLDAKERESYQMTEDLSHIRTTAVEDAKVKVQDELEKLQSDRVRLEGEIKSLRDQVELLEETTEREKSTRRLVEKERELQQRQMEDYKSEITELRAVNKSLVEAKRQLESKLSDLERQVQSVTGGQVQSITSNRQEMLDRQSVDPDHMNSQSTPEVRFVGRDLPRPRVVARSSLPNREETTTMPSRALSKQGTNHDVSVSGSTGYLTGDLQSSRSQPSRSSLFSMSEMDVCGSHSAIRPGVATPFSSLQGVVGPSHSGSGLPSSFREGGRNLLYSRSASSKPLAGSHTRDVLKCFRCGTRFLVTNLDEYEKHIRDCYSDVT